MSSVPNTYAFLKIKISFNIMLVNNVKSQFLLVLLIS